MANKQTENEMEPITIMRADIRCSDGIAVATKEPPIFPGVTWKIGMIIECGDWFWHIESMTACVKKDSPRVQLDLTETDWDDQSFASSKERIDQLAREGWNVEFSGCLS